MSGGSDRITRRRPALVVARRGGAGLLANPATDPAVRVRLGCAFGSLFGLLFIFSDHYQDIPDGKLRQYLNDAIVTLLKDIPAG